MTATSDEVRRLLADAVSEVHPEPALHAIRARTTQPRALASRTWPVALAAAATVAAIVGAFSLTNPSSVPTGGTGPASIPPSAAPSSGTSATASGSPTGPRPVERVLGIYFLGSTPQGPRLYREFRRLTVLPDRPPVFEAVAQALGTPLDPDYRTAWPAGTQVGQETVGQVGPSAEVTVSLSNARTDLRGRPPGMSPREASGGIQQLVYTAQAAVKNRIPVRFELDGRPVSTLLGVDVSRPVANLAELQVLALVSVTSPAEGEVVNGRFTASGVASSFEANVPWQLTRDGKVVKSGYSTAEGWADRLYPWTSGPIDVSRLPPGRYVFTASTDDPSAGEGPGADLDTRTIVVRH